MKINTCSIITVYFQCTVHANMHVIHVHICITFNDTNSLYTITLHLWDTGSVGIPIDNQYG